MQVSGSTRIYSTRGPLRRPLEAPGPASFPTGPVELPYPRSLPEIPARLPYPESFPAGPVELPYPLATPARVPTVLPMEL